jgi:parvulin-like peptidyl-prolyl isomerase
MLSFHSLRVVSVSCALLWAGCRGEAPSGAVPPSERTTATATFSEHPESAEVEPGTGSPPQPPFALPYPRAPWRLAAPEALIPVILSFSQIVIRHADARPEVSFNPAYWFSVNTPTRNRADALALAEQVAEQAAAEPGRFPELARQYSEDLPTREEGGALGNYSAVQLSPWPQVLDALSALEVGQTSKVVETAYGFHIFCRTPPSREYHSSGAHIVIGHDQAQWLAVYARGRRPSRTREQALTLANDIYAHAKAQPDRFSELVQRYSEHRDAIVDGDFGVWSTQEPSTFPPRTKRLQELGIGEVGRPIETHLGFEIIQRTPLRQRTQYRAALLVFPIDSSLTDGPSDPSPELRADALHKAEAALEGLLREPSGFDAPGVTVSQWEEGRQNPELTRALEGLQPGQVTPNPVDTEYGYILAKRLNPVPVQSDQYVWDLPAPNARELGEFLASLPAADSLPFLSGFALTVAPEIALGRKTAKRLAVLHHLPAPTSSGESTAKTLSDLFERTRVLLGADRYARYQAALSREVAARLSPAAAQWGPLGL